MTESQAPKPWWKSGIAKFFEFFMSLVLLVFGGSAIYQRNFVDHPGGTVSARPLGSAFAGDSVTLHIGVRNTGDTDLKGATLVVGPSMCRDGLSLKEGAPAERLTCDVPAEDAKDAGDGVTFQVPSVGTLDTTGPLSIKLLPAPCPALKIGERTDRPTMQQFVQRWNAAVDATRGTTKSGVADACEDLDDSWRITHFTSRGATLAAHASSFKWELDTNDRLVWASLYVPASAANDDQLQRDVLQGVFANATAHDYGQAAKLSSSWKSGCAGPGTVAASTEDDSTRTLDITFCPAAT